MISRITDKIMPEIEEYQKRPLENCYPIIFLDAIHCKVRENSAYTMRAVYMVVGYDMLGHKDLL
jgi:transposase-like protein